MLALFLFGQGFGPGSHTMTFASLSYPASLRGVGVGFNQTLMRASSTVSLFVFPLLVAAFGTGVFWVILLAPLADYWRCWRFAGNRQAMTSMRKIFSKRITPQQ